MFYPEVVPASFVADIDVARFQIVYRRLNAKLERQVKRRAVFGREVLSAVCPFKKYIADAEKYKFKPFPV